MRRKPDPLLRLQPWKILAVFSPIERILHRLEADGTIEVAGRQVVFREDGAGGWYDMPAALRGVIEFHKLAMERYGIPAETGAMQKFANKIESGSPIFEADIAAVRADIESCKRQAMQLRISQAESVIKTVQISAEFDKIGGKAA